MESKVQSSEEMKNDDIDKTGQFAPLQDPFKHCHLSLRIGY